MTVVVVLFSITAYFSQVFIIPRGTMESINCNTITVVRSKNLAIKNETLTKVTATNQDVDTFKNASENNNYHLGVAETSGPCAILSSITASQKPVVVVIHLHLHMNDVVKVMSTLTFSSLSKEQE